MLCNWVCLGKTATEIFYTLQEVYGEESMPCASVFHWHKIFSKSREYVVDEHQTRWPSTSQNDVLVNTVAIMVQDHS